MTSYKTSFQQIKKWKAIILVSFFVFNFFQCIGGSSNSVIIGDEVIEGKPVLASSKPALQQQVITDEALNVIELDEPLPIRIQNSYVAIGKIYEVGLDKSKYDKANYPNEPTGQPFFPPGEYAKLVYNYDAKKLAQANLLEEFQVFYFDDKDKIWKLVDKIEVDLVNHKVTAYTSHFTPFVLTAIPSVPGIAVTDPPKCITNDYPVGSLTSSVAGWTPKFTVLDSYFKYYQDRNYTLAGSASVIATGFQGALGIATCNGTPSPHAGLNNCGSSNNHTYNRNSQAYIQFTTQSAIDVYVMYDVRDGVLNGSGLSDTSLDAPWLANRGFTVVNPPGGMFILSDSPVAPFGGYRIYRRSYLAGENVILDSNLYGIPGSTTSSVNTNYWAVIRPAGSALGTSSPASSLCSVPDLLAPSLAINLEAIPGSDRVFVRWQNPDDTDFAGTVIRASLGTAPASPTDGYAPAGFTPVGQVSSFMHAGLGIGQSICYTLFSLDGNQNYQLPGKSVCATTSTDTDGDGLSDIYEDNTIYPGSMTTGSMNADSDGDGDTDGDEIIAGTNPTNNDALKPTIDSFVLTSTSPTDNPVITYALTASDVAGITGWLITKTADKPFASHSGWQNSNTGKYLLSSSGIYKLYAWVKDAAGNVSDLYPEININLDRIKYSKYLVSGGYNHSGHILKIDPLNGKLTSQSSIGLVPSNGMTTAVDPTNRFIYQMDQGNGSLQSLKLDILTGNLTSGGSTPLATAFRNFKIGLDPMGEYVFVPGGFYTGPMEKRYVKMFRIDAVTGVFTELDHKSTGSQPGNTIIHPNGNFLYTTGNPLSIHKINRSIEELELIGSVPVPSINAYSHMTFDSTGNYAFAATHGAGIISLLKVENNGLLTELNTLATEQNPWHLIIDKNDRFLYIAHQGEKKLTQYEFNKSTETLTLISSTVGDFSYATSLAFDAHGDYLYVAYPFLKIYPGYSGDIYVVYKIDKTDGSLTLHQTLPTNTDTQPYDVSVVNVADGNDPPVVNAGSEQWTALNQVYALNGNNSFDPDANRCQANTINYQFQWTVVSSPGVAPVIVNSNSVSLASFTPTIAGDYVLRLDFTDDPGSCQGIAKTNSATVKIKVGYQHSLSVHEQLPPLIPAHPDAKWHQSKRTPELMGTISAWWVFAPLPFNWGAIPVCISPVSNIPNGFAYCNSQTFGIAYLGFFNYHHTRHYFSGTWTWWDYTP